MVSATEIRDLWETELAEEARRLNKPEPEPWAELARMRWHRARSAIPVLEADPERTWILLNTRLGRMADPVFPERPLGRPIRNP